MISPFATLCRTTSCRIAALITVVLFSLLVNLGLWQKERGEEKVQLEESLANRALQPHLPLNDLQPLAQPVTGIKASTTVSTTDLPLIFLDNQIYQGEVGYLVYQIVQPSQLSAFLLVELGFISALNDRSELPVVTNRLEPSDITGRLYARSSNPLSSDLMAEHMVNLRVQNLNVTQLEQELTISLLPYALQPDNFQRWPYSQPWQPLPMGSAKHFGYSVQWFVMALVWLVLMLAFFLRRYRSIREKIG